MKNILTNSILKLFLLLTFAGALSTAQATTTVVWIGNAGTDFDTANNWQHRPSDGSSNFFALPDSDSEVRIGDYHTPANQPALTSATDYVVSGLSIGYGSNGNGSLSISDGSVEVTSQFNIGQWNNANGTVNLSGGSLKLAKTNHFIAGSSGTGTLNLSGGSIIGTTGSQVRLYMGSSLGGTANLNISGGTINDNSVRLMANQGGTANINITGSSAAMEFENWYLGNGTTNITLTADTTGVSLLDINWLGDSGGTQNLVVDITNYSTANGTTLDLIDCEWATFDSTLWESTQIVGGTGELIYAADGNGTKLSITNIAGTSGDVDTDEDGLPDYVETNTGTYVSATDTGTDPNVADSDGDGLNDAVEVQLGNGFDPNADSSSLIALLPSSGGGLTEQDIIDLRVGSRLAAIADNQATLQIVIEESTDLSTWSENQTTDVQVTVPEGTTKQFFRYSMGD